MYSIHFNNNPLRVRKLHKDSFVNYICFPRFLRKSVMLTQELYWL